VLNSIQPLPYPSPTPSCPGAAGELEPQIFQFRCFIGKRCAQAPLYTARLTILQGFYRQKSCLDPCAYSKGVNITGVIWGKVAIRSCTPIQKMQYDMGCIVKSRAQAPLYTAKVSILQGRYREK